MQRMPGRQLSGIWRLVDEHGVHGADVGADEGFDVVLKRPLGFDQFRVKAA